MREIVENFQLTKHSKNGLRTENKPVFTRFELEKRQKIQFSSQRAPNFLKLWWLTQHTPYVESTKSNDVNTDLFLCKAIFKVPFCDAFPTSQKIVFKIISFD